ncbi:MAG: sigma-70 family RNA polymerase sigma factor [Oscillospiraceae bacterium]|jgi:RNA polymerase sigma factor (sigma-70 family)|nr:sigma-70 family RNA polymerase sigma factor [Oscillospiraceae bacterium]
MNREKDDFLAELYQEMKDRLYSYAYMNIRDYHRAEELVQDVFLLASQKIDSVMQSPNPRGWLVNALQFVLKREYRSHLNIQKAFVEQSAYTEDMEDSTSNSAEDEAFKMLELSSMFKADEWHLLKRAYIERYTIAEIAEELGIEYAACAKRLQKASNKARKLFGEERF